MIVMIDNYDSFTYNLYQMIGSIDPDIVVYRNDEITADEVISKTPSRIIISPGTGVSERCRYMYRAYREGRGIFHCSGYASDIRQ